ncbi:MAG: sulfatase-like hydrolase/transferase [Acidobacteriota bacterium]
MPQLSRRALLAGLAGSLPATTARPNILFVMVDEMRWDALGCANHPVVRTPTLDRLAREGVRFSSAYTVSPVCSPARASAFTGRYAHVHGVTGNGIPAHNGEIFLPSIVKHYGYHTAIAGKLHYTPARFDYGFDQFWSFSAEGPTPDLGYNAYLKKKHGSPGKWPIVPGTCPWPDDPLGRDVGLFKHPREDFETEWITARSIEYLRSRKDQPQPWFLFTSFLKPHSPSVEPEPFFSMYDPKVMPIPKLPPNAREMRAAQRDRARRHWVDDERMMRVMSALYYGAITHVDEQVGRVLTELDKLGMAANTLVLFTADHGNMLGDRGRWFKGIQYEGSARVPLLWRDPRVSPENSGGVVEKVVENTDLLPSILETAGIPAPAGVQGRSLLNLARGKDPNWKDRCYSQLRSAMVVDGRWKFIDNSLDCTGTRELYDLKNDPKEERDLAADPKNRDRLEQCCRQLTAWRADRPAPIRIAGMATPAYAQIPETERREAIRSAPDNLERPRRKR